MSRVFSRPGLHRAYVIYTLGFIVFLLVLALLEQAGLSRGWIGFIFLVSTVCVYAAIGIFSRTSDVAEYYVAGRRVPAVYNGMATGADWMSAASFIGLAGTLYLSGYAGLAFVIGWTGGYCLVALLLAPFLRRFGQYTIPDFLGARYGGQMARAIGLFSVILCSFTYLVAQIYGVGLITTRLTGVQFEIGIFLGLAGVLVCSFLGGMRAVTWTQVAQYIILIIAYMIPVVWLSIQQTSIPVPQLAYGSQLEKVTALEAQFKVDAREIEVIEVFRLRADRLSQKLQDVEGTLDAEKSVARQQIAALKTNNAPMDEILAAERFINNLPADAESARQQWTHERDRYLSRAQPLGGMPDHERVYSGNPQGTLEEQGLFNQSRANFLALVFCLTLGTAALPHILIRYYTTPSVQEARESVVWSLVFIAILYCTAPALAVLVKYEVFSSLIGTSFDQLPDWIANWSAVDSHLLALEDVNGDGVLQLGEMQIGGDIIMLATPEIAGLPYVVSGLVAAGGLAAALSTADGLLLSISSALSHDLYYRIVNPSASPSRRVSISKALLLVVALAAAYAAAHTSDILGLVSAAFSFAAAAFFPSLVLGVFWSRATRQGAIVGMLVGLGVTGYYMAANHPTIREVLGFSGIGDGLWFGISPISAGLFGVPAGFVSHFFASLVTKRPHNTDQFLSEIRFPRTD